MLNITANLADTTRWNSVQVFLGRTYDPVEIIRRTPSTSLIPGVNLIGFGQRQLRQQFTDPTMSALGLFDVSKLMNNFWHKENNVPSPQVIHDFYNVWISSCVARPPGRYISSYHPVTQCVDPSHRCALQFCGMEDYPTKSRQIRVEGICKHWWFVDIPGWYLYCLVWNVDLEDYLWYAVLSNRMVSVWISIVPTGTKPLSVFGLTRSFVGDKIKDACRKEYPRMESDLKVSPGDKGLIAFMADHLVNFDFLKDSVGQSSSDENAPPVNMDEDKEEKSDAIPLLPITNDTTRPPSSPMSSNKTLSV